MSFLRQPIYIVKMIISIIYKAADSYFYILQLIANYTVFQSRILLGLSYFSRNEFTAQPITHN